MSKPAQTTPSTPTYSPLFKWTGGKRRELPQISQFYPDFVKQNKDGWKYVEPFVGGGAVYWALANPNSVLNDFDSELMNFYKMVAAQHPKFLKAVADAAKAFDKVKIKAAKLSDDQAHRNQEQVYYTWRNLDRKGGLSTLPDWKRAARFFIVNQLAFSGMRRFNSAGEFNVPYGHYKSFNAAAVVDEPRVQLLGKATLLSGDYAAVLAAHDDPDTFIFIDPPYTRVMKTYSAGATFGDKEQEALRDALVGLKNARFMVVIDSSELTEDLYKDHIIHRYDVSYGVNIRNRFDQAAKHLIATNYTP